MLFTVFIYEGACFCFYAGYARKTITFSKTSWFFPALKLIVIGFILLFSVFSMYIAGGAYDSMMRGGDDEPLYGGAAVTAVLMVPITIIGAILFWKARRR